MLPKKHCKSSKTQTAIKHQAQESQTIAQNITEKIAKETQVRNRNFFALVDVFHILLSEIFSIKLLK